MTYFFFLTKAAIVNKVEKRKDTFVYWLNKLTFWGVAMFIPCFVVPYAAVKARGVITAEGVCVLFLQQVWFPAFFIAGNIGLCSALLFLFVRPLNMTAAWVLQYNASADEALRMRAVARKNMILASVMAAFATASVIGTCVVTALANADMVAYDFVLTYSYASTIVDLTACNLCARAMTNLWMPPILRNRVCNKLTSSTEDHSDNLTPSNNQAISPPSSIRISPLRAGERTESTRSHMRMAVVYDRGMDGETAV
jgi:hypothetical protein